MTAWPLRVVCDSYRTRDPCTAPVHPCTAPLHPCTRAPHRTDAPVAPVAPAQPSGYSHRRAPSVGRNVRRKDADAKVTGAAKYIDDLSFPGHAARDARSARRFRAGRSTSIRLDFDTAGFTVVDYRDIPGRNIVALIDDDQPCLAEHEVYHVAEPILLLAHADRDRLATAQRARSTTRRSRRSSIPSDRRGRSRTIDDRRRARSTQGFADADVIVEGEYRTGHQEQLYIETNGVIAVPDGDAHDGLRIAAVPVLRAPRADGAARSAADDKVRVVQTETGGGFGGKEEYPSHIACHAALLARKAQPAGEDDLRPRRGHARDDEAASVDRPPSHRRDARRPPDGDGHRRRARRRRLLHAESRSCCRAACFTRPGRTAARTCASAAARCGPTRRRTARSAASARRRRSLAIEVHMDRIADDARHRSGDAARDQRAASRATPPRPARCSATMRARCRCCAKRCGAAASRASARQWQGTTSRHRAVAVLPRLGLHRQRRDQAGVESVARADRARARASSSRPPRSARARARCTRRSSPTRCGIPYDAVEVDDADTGARARQRADRGLAHVHGRRTSAAARGGGDARAARRRSRRPRISAKHGSFVVTTQYEQPPEIDVGRRALSRRRLRQLRLGLQRRRARGRSGHVGGDADSRRRPSPRSARRFIR